MGRRGELALQEGIDDKLLDALNRPRKYREIMEEVRRHLAGTTRTATGCKSWWRRLRPRARR